MRLLLTGLACVLLVSAGWTEEKKASDKDKIQGTWTVVSGEHGGKPIPEDAAKDTKVVFTADKMMVTSKDNKFEATYKLDPDKKPKEIDVDIQGKTGKGIYELDGDTLKIAHGEIGDARPKEFPTKEGSGLNIMVFKRAKP